MGNNLQGLGGESSPRTNTVATQNQLKSLEQNTFRKLMEVQKRLEQTKALIELKVNKLEKHSQKRSPSR